MSRASKALDRVMNRFAERNIRFDELCALLRHLQFVERTTRGSHHVFSRDGVWEILNLQPRHDGLAKPYQVRQVRDIIIRYALTVDRSVEESDDT
jgi:hypothetical protein